MNVPVRYGVAQRLGRGSERRHPAGWLGGILPPKAMRGTLGGRMPPGQPPGRRRSVRTRAAAFTCHIGVRITTAALLVALMGLGCHPPRTAGLSRSARAHIDAARNFTDRYSRSRLAAWNIRASAAGADCDILKIEIPIILEDSMVEAIHYGAGSYNVYAGGVQHFSLERTFRAVSYKDASGRVWTYGSLSRNQAEALMPCR